ncbi:hypothetical protein GCM10009676_45780 [Prauserella halophila]|uniref:ABC transporter domain-containing protein n=1 Tax=Prauserella halophila TaxID=185641 RepID=A0ABN1WLE0_9PSEU|nr:ABC transporter [Prauserella halophila]
MTSTPDGVPATPASAAPTPDAATPAPATSDAATPAPATPDTAAPILAVRDLERTYRGGVHALRGVSLDVPRGGRFGIVGESGSGKSTLVRLLAALDRPTAGTVTFDRRRIDDRRDRDLGFLRRRLQVVFQDPMGSLDPRMRVRDIISEPLGRTRGRDERVAELLEAVDLPADAGLQYPHRFSGGQRQRISIARALAPQPEVLIADEAVSALDVLVRKQILDLLTRLVDEYALTLVFVSHDLGVVRKVCDEVAVMRRGELVEHGPVDDVYDAPRHDYTRELIAAAPTLHGALSQPQRGRSFGDAAPVEPPGPEPPGPEPHGPEPHGPEPHGPEPHGPEPHGPEPQAAEPQSSESQSPESQAPESPDPESPDPESSRSEYPPSEKE